MVAFRQMLDHIDAPRPWAPDGVAVWSETMRGESPLAAPAPSIKMVLEGEAFYEVDGRRLRLEPGQFLYVDRGDISLGFNRRTVSGLCLLLPYSEATVEIGEEEEGEEPLLHRAAFFSTETSVLGRTLRHFASLLASDPEAGVRLAPFLMAEAVARLDEPLTMNRQAARKLDAAKPSTRSEILRRLEIARDHLHANHRRAVDLAELASRCGLSRFHMARYFKLAFGSPPSAYHRGLRLAEARRLLERGASLTEAAAAVGYADATSLSHAMRRRSMRR